LGKVALEKITLESIAEDLLTDDEAGIKYNELPSSKDVNQ